MNETITDIISLINQINDGSKIAIFKDCSVPMSLGRGLIKRQVRNLHLVTVPTGSFLPDMLIGAGCVSTIETAGVSLGEFGLANRFGSAIKEGSVTVLDATCPAIYAGLQASEKGIPFIPLRGLIGSDVLANRGDFQIIDNPFERDDPIAVLPAIQPDFTLFHAPMADQAGNVYLGRQAELKIMAHASKKTFVTVEKIVDFNIMDHEELGSASLSHLYVDGIAVASNGSWPLNLPGHYDYDRKTMQSYAHAAKNQETFNSWVDIYLGKELRETG
ncbi:MAG: CoA-transferase [Gammaproteobacteria bacterium]|jgi:glutaconate CoA-transferase, subunit A|nr:CoA synthetase [Pseudomonadota bacterium]MDG2302528.1 CoA-transferase [Gammaproteobacteria bacterium]MBT5066634.1 CoA synthetase [Pseudomonadota bacterium]MBT6191935.1 CoA synthetase [Pseudomonadota bacterium]MBT6674119.1 CoA synthetase [Pseudomonadota bacterium]